MQKTLVLSAMLLAAGTLPAWSQDPAQPLRADGFAFSHFEIRNDSAVTRDVRASLGDLRRDVAATRSSPRTPHHVLDQQDQWYMRTPRNSGAFQFHFKDDVSGTQSQIGSFSLKDLPNGTHCFKIPEGAFVRTRCY